jgi:xylulokinase
VTTLTLDLGTSATKAALWDGAELLALTRTSIETTHPAPGRAEQDPLSWWSSVVGACSDLRAEHRRGYGAVAAVGLTAARETFALFDASLTALGSGIVWSDQRATEEVTLLGDPHEFRARTGVVASAGCCAAKVRWVQAHDPEAWRSSRWLLAPRDLVVARMTGAIFTDETLASRTGFYDLDGARLEPSLDDRLPPVVASTTVLTVGDGADDLHLRAGTPVTLGAGDRPCEVLGVGATSHLPMVSWGTTANVSVPHHGPPTELPEDAQVSRGALGGFVIEAGLSAAGAALAWLARLTGSPEDELLAAASAVRAGADGVVALPWFAGARAPWWEPHAHAALLGLTEAHGAAELTRAVVEGVAYDVARCVELVAPRASELALAGRGAAGPLWRQVVAAISGLPVVRRAVDDAASVGARLLVAAAMGEVLPLDDVNPVTSRTAPDAELEAAYSSLRDAADAAAWAVIRGE